MRLDESNSPLVEQFVATLRSTIAQEVVVTGKEVSFQSVGRIANLDWLLQTGGTSTAGALTFAIEELGVAYPRDIRHAVWQLRDYLSHAPAPKSTVPLVVAQFLSEGSREILRSEGIGYFDSSGSLHFEKDRWFVHIDRPPHGRPQHRMVDLFTEARELVLHALLSSNGEWLTAAEIALKAKTSAATVSTTVQELEKREWVEPEGDSKKSRRRLTKPTELLNAWAEHWSKRKETRTRWYVFCPPGTEPLLHLSREIEREMLSDWAFTGAAAANVVSPLLTNVNTFDLVVPPGRTDAFVQALNLKPAERGFNLSIVERGGVTSKFADYPSALPARIASPIVLYLDLLNGQGRNKELAQYLRTEILKI